MMLIVFEGIDGSGKSTQAKMFADWLGTVKSEYVCRTSEPGGTDIGRQIRQILLSKQNDNMTPLTEALLYAADRAQHIEEYIAPLLNKGRTVVSDRLISTFAYQAVGMDSMVLWQFNGPALGMLPDEVAGRGAIFFLDVPVKQCMERLAKSGKVDRMEAKGCDYFAQVRENYIKLMQVIPMIRIDCDGLSVDEVQNAIRERYNRLTNTSKED